MAASDHLPGLGVAKSLPAALLARLDRCDRRPSSSFASDSWGSPPSELPRRSALRARLDLGNRLRAPAPCVAARPPGTRDKRWCP
jgi:hypothetical protein